MHSTQDVAEELEEEPWAWWRKCGPDEVQADLDDLAPRAVAAAIRISRAREELEAAEEEGREVREAPAACLEKMEELQERQLRREEEERRREEEEKKKSKIDAALERELRPLFALRENQGPPEGVGGGETDACLVVIIVVVVVVEALQHRRRPASTHRTAATPFSRTGGPN